MFNVEVYNQTQPRRPITGLDNQTQPRRPMTGLRIVFTQTDTQTDRQSISRNGAAQRAVPFENIGFTIISSVAKLSPIPALAGLS